MTWLVPFLGGLAGSLHCVGMCGGFPLALAGGGQVGNGRRQLLYNLGRLNTLVFIGAVSGGFGQALVAAAPFVAVERTLAVFAGVVMVVIGAEVLGVMPQVSARAAAFTRATVGRLLGSVIRSRSAAAPLALGVFNAFLPCQMIYAFAASAASTRSATDGMLVMLAFGLGTVPAMLALGVTRALAAPRVRARLSLAAGVLVVLFGLVTILRGFDLLPHGAHGDHAGHDHAAHEHAAHDHAAHAQ
jgi:sulfite exporter TauE/SafE